MPDLDTIKAVVLGGAIGDALGAPLEGERDFQVLLDKFGPEGVQEFVEPVSTFDDKTDFQKGATTDDTASLVGVIAALGAAKHNDKENLLYHLWQANLIWGSHQAGGEGIAEFVDRSINWPEWYHPFYTNLGAGKGTIAALLEGRMGTLEKPMNVDRVVKGKHISGPNKGCGGMMRVAPIGLLPLDEEQVVDLALRSTAITHGAPEAQAAAALIALTIRKALTEDTLVSAGYEAMETLEHLNIPGSDICRKAFNTAANAAALDMISPKTANSLPRELDYKNEFLAIPVLSQVVYGTLIAEQLQEKENSLSGAFLKTLACVTTISGDSDSVGSIVGNILAAKWGTESLPEHLLWQLKGKDSLDQAATSLRQNIQTYGIA